MHDINETGKMLIIINPVSGRGRSIRSLATIEKIIRDKGINYEKYITGKPGDAESYCCNLPINSYTRIISVGGDGTLTEIINGLAARWLKTGGEHVIPIPIGIIPTGTGNDFARTIGIPTNLNDCVGIALGNTSRRYDLGIVNNRYFLNVSGTGFDAEVVKRVNEGFLKGLVKGTTAYLLSVLVTLLTFRSFYVDITLDNETFNKKILLIAIGNGKYYGGGMMITPEAEPDDGMLDVCLIEEMPVLDFIMNLASVFSGKHVGHPRVKLHRAKSIRVCGDSKLKVQADGELVSCLPAEWSLVDRAIEVLVPYHS